jgi:probable rRNA maturation factor
LPTSSPPTKTTIKRNPKHDFINVSGAAVVVASDERTVGDSDDVSVDIDRWRQLASAALAAEGSVGELTLTFVDRVDIAELNSQYMGKTGATDVLSFPMADEPEEGVPVLLGDVVLSPSVAFEQCGDHAGTIDDEFALLVIHGVLHILGHDHLEETEARAMRERELELLVAHHWKGPPPPAFRQTHD